MAWGSSRQMLFVCGTRSSAHTSSSHGGGACSVSVTQITLIAMYGVRTLHRATDHY